MHAQTLMQLVLSPRTLRFSFRSNGKDGERPQKTHPRRAKNVLLGGRTEIQDSNGNTDKYLGDANITPLTPKSMNRYLFTLSFSLPLLHSFCLSVCLCARRA